MRTGVPALLNFGDQMRTGIPALLNFGDQIGIGVLTWCSVCGPVQGCFVRPVWNDVVFQRSMIM